jgi:3-oxoacyl-[acyl-carrier protein] reductase
MMKRRWGRIIGISSISGVVGNAGQANYSAAKAGMIGMTKALAQEVASRNVTVNCVAPGFIDTAMTEVLDEKVKTAFLGRIPAGRFGTSEEVAAAVLYLASNEAAYTTGHTISVNGGMAMV